MLKAWWRSKTIWANVGMALVAVGTEFLALVEFIPPEQQFIARLSVTAFIAVGNVILRTVTYEAIGR